MAKPGNHQNQPAQKRYRAENRRYKNKIRKAKKRYIGSPKLLQNVLDNIKQMPKRFKGGKV